MSLKKIDILRSGETRVYLKVAAIVFAMIGIYATIGAVSSWGKFSALNNEMTEPALAVSMVHSIGTMSLAQFLIGSFCFIVSLIIFWRSRKEGVH